MTSRSQFACFTLPLLVLSSVMVQAQARNSGAQTIALSATLTDGLTVNVSSHSVSLALTAGSASNAGTSGVTATTSWISKAGHTLSVFAYFSSATAALSDGFGDYIPSADFLISNNGGAYAPLTSTVAFGGAAAGLQLFNVKITGANKTGSHTDSMLFNINLSTLPQLPAGTYTGTLNIQAQII
jgi:hypothetical protein